MAKFFTRKPDDFKERSEVEKQGDRTASEPTLEKISIPYEVHRQGPLTYFDCSVEDINQRHQATKSPKSALSQRSRLKGLVGLGLLTVVLGVGLVIVHLLTQRSRPAPKVSSIPVLTPRSFL